MTRSKAKTGTTSEHAFGRVTGSPFKQRAEEAKERGSPIKNKPSTGLSALLSKGKSSKNDAKEEAKRAKDKENQTPPNSAGGMPPPIWAEFSKQDGGETPRTTKVPLNDSCTFEEVAKKYTPPEYSPSKGRNFFFDQPRLNNGTNRTRPTSFVGPSSSVTRPTETPKSRPKSFVQSFDNNSMLLQGENLVPDLATGSARPRTEGEVDKGKSASGLTIAKRGSRVMAAVAAWNGKGKDETRESQQDVKEDPKDPQQIESAFERMLVGLETPSSLQAVLTLGTGIEKHRTGRPRQDAAA